MKVEGGKKEDDRYIGPFRVIRKRHERSYGLINNEGKKYTRNVEDCFTRKSCKDLLSGGCVDFIWLQLFEFRKVRLNKIKLKIKLKNVLSLSLIFKFIFIFKIN